MNSGPLSDLIKAGTPRRMKRSVSTSISASSSFPSVTTMSQKPSLMKTPQCVPWALTSDKSAGQGGAIHQGRQERDQMDAAVVPQVPRQRGSTPASRPGLQPRQLHADFGSARRGGALVADDDTGKVGEDRSQGRLSRSLCHFPTGRGCGAKKAVPENPEPDC
jgi:hypothetical protein